MLPKDTIRNSEAKEKGQGQGKQGNRYCPMPQKICNWTPYQASVWEQHHIEKFKECFLKYKESLNDNWIEEWPAWHTEYSDIDRIFLTAFSKPGQINHFVKDNLKLEDLKNIYNDRIFALEESMNLNENKIHSSHMIRKQAEIIKTPFYYDGFYLGWNRVISGGKIYKYFFIILILCSSFVFYEEIIFSSSIEFSLATKNGRKVHSIAKIKALIIITTIIFIFSIGLYTMLTFYVFGTDGGKNQMQILSFYSLFNGTLAQATILRFAILYFAGIFFSILTFFISLYIKNMLATIVLSGACFYIGTVIPKGSIFERLIFLFPSSAISFSQLFYRPIVYNFFGKPILLCYMYIPASIAMSIILSVLIVRKFEKMEY